MRPPLKFGKPPVDGCNCGICESLRGFPNLPILGNPPRLGVDYGKTDFATYLANNDAQTQALQARLDALTYTSLMRGPTYFDDLQDARTWDAPAARRWANPPDDDAPMAGPTGRLMRRFIPPPDLLGDWGISRLDFLRLAGVNAGLDDAQADVRRYHQEMKPDGPTLHGCVICGGETEDPKDDDRTCENCRAMIVSKAESYARLEDDAEEHYLYIQLFTYQEKRNAERRREARKQVRQEEEATVGSDASA